MPADCLACAIREPFMDPAYRVGSPGDPIGCCINCFSLMCGHHGRRDPKVPEFICIMCLPNLAAALAAGQVTSHAPASMELEPETLSELRRLFRAHADIFPSELLRLEDPVSYFEQWKPQGETFARAGDMRGELKTNGVMYTDEFATTIRILLKNEKAHRLLAIARLAIDYYDLHKHVPYRLQRVLNAINWNGYQERTRNDR